MTNKDKLYAVGSVVCVVAIGAVAFYLIKNNSSTKAVSAAPQTNLTQNADSNQNLQAQTSESQISDSTVPATSVADNSIADSGNSSDSSSNANPSDTPSAPSNPANGTPGRRGPMANIPAGSKPIFGQVASVSGSQIVVTTMGRRGGPATPGGTATDSTTAPTKTTINVTLTSTTTFSGGTKDAIVAGARIFGYGTVNADGSINATNIQINPTMPGGGGFNRGGQNQPQQ